MKARVFSVLCEASAASALSLLGVGAAGCQPAALGVLIMAFSKKWILTLSLSKGEPEPANPASAKAEVN